MSRHEYRSPEIVVSFDPRRCIHAEECVHGLPLVFDRNRRPWIAPENADAASIAEVVRRCPTGALHYVPLDGAAEELPVTPAVITPVPDGPLYLRGDLEIIGEEGSVLITETRAALCRCGGSSNKPFCDGTHARIGFKAP